MSFLVSLSSSRIHFADEIDVRFLIVVTTGWAMESTIEAHFERIKGRLAMGRGALERIHGERTLTTYDVPDVVADEAQLLYEPPLATDP